MTNAQNSTAAAANTAVHTLARGLVHLPMVRWSHERDTHVATCPDCDWTAEARFTRDLHTQADQHYATA
ncbi:hypothetical protein [Brachybacterium sp. UNK5269]|uniref:hypothetical protein n=1 Tax=Brachybacterium sp. UNK5269 TaxID=3408576 RepID=UPI003BB167B2